ncbi:hypothetical protein Kpol_363p4 [Vanderwaltozyma polyspora DSM 70294]|uniref:SP-RING-type domain-containing protein n=1 Tax=Vanderwaltozyma polyspora (strain ATCC 22028 / DSM 70294 / BCRC 21397 / CBS 2163 / NBRC 10782 / NRRL Y-8283 / UCD 57-17) TaxID=436907 RepID=A7TS87_VANPO|nr:uncharacterized protein Kpol_363p4 [Vanderwaltozyma polyspora DSM 70294]EDO14864.1 hypothetical protein Kpol_363p4 [Vanderwaltozyma polyspora DSM 70294]
MKNSSDHTINIISSERSISEIDGSVSFRFVRSPFYEPECLLLDSVMSVNPCNERMTETVRFTIDQHWVNILQKKSGYKLHLFSGEVNDIESDDDNLMYIKFPWPNELRFNNEIIKDNIKGLKNQKGTTNPADLTNYLRLDGEQNQLEFVHGALKSEYVMCCCIVRCVSPDQLLLEILEHSEIVPLSQTVKLITDGDEEGDILASSFILSLKCPISFKKIQYPSRSKFCNHIECFDSYWYLVSQSQIPNWKCPICSSKAKLEDLVICELVSDILENCEDEVSQVKFYSDGSWEEIFDSDTDSLKSTDSLTITQINSSSMIHSSEEPDMDLIICLDSDDDSVDNDKTHSLDILNFEEEVVHRVSKTTNTEILNDPSSSQVLHASDQSLDPNLMGELSMNGLLSESSPRREQSKIIVPNILGGTPLNDDSFMTDDENRILSPSSTFGSLSFSADSFSLLEYEKPSKKSQLRKSTTPDISIITIDDSESDINLQNTTPIKNQSTIKRQSTINIPRDKKSQSLHEMLLGKSRPHK